MFIYIYAYLHRETLPKLNNEDAHEKNAQEKEDDSRALIREELLPQISASTFSNQEVLSDQRMDISISV
ncbi:hypothetical protein Taro_043750 [Colocasia esculenta]|uniref:Uncharacterized protein n=1 Tax=Colocasia esculenta TaxID=4460 RepID=A0A843WH96_COLES|nr:hypothetical protein [Colocasia esculenta]